MHLIKKVKTLVKMRIWETLFPSDIFIRKIMKIIEIFFSLLFIFSSIIKKYGMSMINKEG